MVFTSGHNYKMMERKITKGNVFKDIGFTDEEAIALATRVDLDKKHNTHTLDWYIKWFASFILIIGMILRTTQEHMFIDITLSMLGATGWLIVGIMWKDRALIMLNGIAATILFYGFVVGLIQ